MTVGFKPCRRLIPDDIPRERLHPLAGKELFGMELEGIEPSTESRQKAPEGIPAPAPQNRASGSNLLDSLAFFIMGSIIKML